MELNESLSSDFNELTQELNENISMFLNEEYNIIKLNRELDKNISGTESRIFSI